MTTRRVIAEYDAETTFWLVMLQDGSVRHFQKAVSILGFLRGQDKRRAQRRGVSTTTIIECRNVPAGFVPPATEVK